MKRFLNYAAAAAAALCASILLGAILLILVFKLPTGEMKNNVQRSTPVYDYEGVYPQLMAGYKMSQLDNCTDATMLLNAITPPTSYRDAMLVYRTNYADRNPTGSLTDYANDVKSKTYVEDYPRYWHGYLVILKPLLLFFDVSDIRVFNMFLQSGLLLYIIWQMMKKKRERFLVPFIVSLLLMNPITIPLSFQFSTVSYIMLFSVIIALKNEAWTFARQLFFFMLIGIATAYFDFLTFPLVGLYFPLIFMLMAEKSIKSSLKLVVLGSISWIFGYAGMWGGKWLIGSLITGRNIFKNAMAGAGKYTGHEIGAVEIIFKNMQVLMKYPILFLGIGLLIYYIMQFIKSQKSHGVSIAEYVPFALIAFAPICWYIAAGTHSYIHYWFTYRELCVSVFAMLTGTVKVCGIEKSADSQSADSLTA